MTTEIKLRTASNFGFIVFDLSCHSELISESHRKDEIPDQVRDDAINLEINYKRIKPTLVLG